jgi:hypothetical protein
VVHIPVNDQHKFSSGQLSVASGDYHIVHQTETHSFGGEGMMSWGANGGKCMSPSGHHVIRRRQHRTGPAEHREPAFPTENRIQKKCPAASSAHGFESGKVRFGMHDQQPLSRCGLCLFQVHIGPASETPEQNP